MAVANLSWTPVGGAFSLSQNIDYKALNDVGWYLYSNVSADTNSATISGLSYNVIYQFRVGNMCPETLTNLSLVVEGTSLTCPYVSVTPGFTTAAFSFAHLGGNISAYVVELLSVSDVVLDSKTFNSPGSTVADTFTGLTLSTTYKIRVTVNAQGSLSLYTQGCPAVTFVTSVCSPPTEVSAVMS
jgi:hypothetical protein